MLPRLGRYWARGRDGNNALHLAQASCHAVSRLQNSFCTRLGLSCHGNVARRGILFAEECPATEWPIADTMGALEARLPNLSRLRGICEAIGGSVRDKSCEGMAYSWELSS